MDRELWGLFVTGKIACPLARRIHTGPRRLKTFGDKLPLVTPRAVNGAER